MKTFSEYKFHNDPHLHVGKIERVSEVNGPGRRFVIWAQGCHFNCPKCMNFELQSFMKHREEMMIPQLLKMIDETPGIEGVTFTGGEPFDQARGFYHLSLGLKERGLSIVSYSGYKKDEIVHSRYSLRKALLKNLDILIDGRFESDKVAPLLWRGSSNQKVYFLSNRYKREDFIDKTEVEILLDEATGKMTITGGLSFNTIEELEKELGVTLQGYSL